MPYGRQPVDDPGGARDHRAHHLHREGAMKPWHQRTLWRALLATAITVLATLKASIGEGLDNAEWVDLVSAGVVAFAAWYGIGAIPRSPTEPFLNNDNPGSVDVPVPPADPEPAK